MKTRLSPSTDPLALQTALEETTAGWYLAPREQQVPDLVWSDLIEDGYWNYAVRSVEVAESLPQRGRRPAVWWPEGEAVDEDMRGSGYALLSEASVLVAVRPPAAQSTGLRIVEVTDGADTADLLATFGQAFGGAEGEVYGALPPSYSACLARAVGRPGTSHFVGYLDGTPVALGSLALWDGYAGLYNGGVLPAYRRRGFGRDMLRHRTRRALEAGATTVFFQTETGGPVERGYASDGFAIVDRGRIYTKQS